MVKHVVSSLRQLRKDYGEDGDIALVCMSDTNHIFPTRVIYTKEDGIWKPDKWYKINGKLPEPEQPDIPDMSGYVQFVEMVPITKPELETMWASK